MRHNRLPKISDKGINFDGYLNTIRQTNKLMNIQFDPTIFVVQDDPSGMYISMNPQSATTTSNASGYHLSGEVTQSNCAGAGGTLIVRGGLAVRKTNSDVYVIPLTCDSGPSEFYEDYKTVSGITSSKYVFAELDDPLIPTTLTIDTNATYPVDDANKYTKFVLGYANVTSDVLTWEPYREMDLIPDSPILPDTNMPIVDNRSLEFRAADGRLQLYGLSNAASKFVVGVEPTGTGVDITYRDTNVAAQTCGIGPNVAGTDDTISNTGHQHHISAADFATSSNSCSHATWADHANSASGVLHSELVDIVGGVAGDDHQLPNQQYLLKTGDNTRNAVDYGFGDVWNRYSIKVTDRTLNKYDGVNVLICASWADNKWWGQRINGDGAGHIGYCSANFTDRILYSGVGDYFQMVNYNLGYLFDGTDVYGTNITLKWTTGKLCTISWEAENPSDIVTETYSGGFLIAGGATCKKTMQADKFTILDDNDNYWTANVFSAVTTDNIILNSPAILYGNTSSSGITISNWCKIGGVVGANVVSQVIFANTGSSVVQMEVLARIL